MTVSPGSSSQNSGSAIGEIRRFAALLIGENALERERIYHEVKRLLRQQARVGLAPLDIALRDIAGKFYDAPIYQLLGGYRKRLPVYASTFLGGDKGGLDSPEAYADFAEHCLELGYTAYKVHPWWHGPISQEVAMVHAVGERVGGKMDLMLDPACAYDMFGDAVKVGRVCDEHNFYWYEDPFQDGGVTHHAHLKLRELIKTPLLMAEHVRGLEEHMNFIMADATDFIRGDVPLDGITATMKLAHAAEALGLDVELHGGDIGSQHCMAAIRNSNFLEWGLVHPKMEMPPINPDGTVSVPEEPGLGAHVDWKHIEASKTGYQEFT